MYSFWKRMSDDQTHINKCTSFDKWDGIICAHSRPQVKSVSLMASIIFSKGSLYLIVKLHIANIRKPLYPPTHYIYIYLRPSVCDVRVSLTHVFFKTIHGEGRYPVAQETPIGGRMSMTSGRLFRQWARNLDFSFSIWSEGSISFRIIGKFDT